MKGNQHGKGNKSWKAANKPKPGLLASESAKANMCKANWSRKAEIWLQAIAAYDLYLAGKGCKRIAKELNGKHSAYAIMAYKFKCGWNPSICEVYANWLAEQRKIKAEAGSTPAMCISI